MKYKNALSKAAQVVGMTFGPEAYTAGKQRQAQGERKNALALAGEEFKAGNYDAAAAPLFESGNLEGGISVLNYGREQQQQARETEQTNRTTDLTKLFHSASELRRMPMEQRAGFAQRMAAELKIPAPQSMEDLTDAALDQDLAMLRVELQKGAPQAPETKYMKSGDDIIALGPNGPELAYDAPDAGAEWVDIPAPAGQAGIWQKNIRTGQTKRVAAPPSGGITIAPDGTVRIGGSNGGATTRQFATNDAQLMKDLRQREQDLQPVLNTMYAARSELLGPDGVEGTDDDLDTGSYAPIVQMGRRLLPGEQENEARYDNFDALSKEFGIEKLAGIGGNDTERELLTAIQTGANVGAQEKSNLSRLNRQIAVFEFIGESRRNFTSEWINQHGTTDPNVPARAGRYAGMTYDQALSVYQREVAQSQGLLGAAPSGQSAPSSAVGVMPQQGDLTDEEYQEYLTLQREVNGG